jgi:hypothetical protein
MQTRLPQGFAALEPYVACWAVDGTAARAQLRTDSTAQERQAFFDAAKNLAAPGLDLLDQKPLAELDDSEQRLMNLLLAFTHVAIAVEVQAEDEVKHAGFRNAMRITRSTADMAA